MSFDPDALIDLLPAIYLIRDRELTPDADEAGPLESLLGVIAEELAAFADHLDQFYDDQFIETCAEWVVPYIGDLIGYRALHGAATKGLSARAEVAHTIALRRRKGTAAMLEQLARDVTGWNARAVEFFERLAATQYMNHPRRHVGSADLRAWEPLERVDTAFDLLSHTVDVRRIRNGLGRYNIPNVGLFLWRLEAFSLTKSPAVKVDDRRYRLSPLGHDLPIFSRPDGEGEGLITHIAEPINVPEPLTRRMLLEDVSVTPSERTYVGAGRSFALYVDGADKTADLRICNLGGDDGTGWAHEPPDDTYALDPALGRVALPGNLPVPTKVEATFHYGFSAEIGGGEYGREETIPPSDQAPVRVPDDHAKVQDALDAIAGDGIVEITDSGRYKENLTVNVVKEKRVVLRAADGRRPTLEGGLSVKGETDSAFELNGLLVTGGQLDVPTDANELRELSIVHATLVPGWTLTPDGTPERPEPSLVAGIADLQITLDRMITGGLRVDPGATVRINESIVDATSTSGVAYADADDGAPGGELSVEASTVIGKVSATVLRLISNCVLLAHLDQPDAWPAPVRAERKQEGCVRFSYVPIESRVPRRYACHPADTAEAGRVVPRFVSLRYGTPAYCQLYSSTSDEIRRGADDEGEMGALHLLHQPQRTTNLRIRLAEYLRVGLEAGILFET